MIATSCASCGKSVYFLPHARTREIGCIETAPCPEGNIVIEASSEAAGGAHYRLLTKQEMEQGSLFGGPPATRYISHFARCPHASRWRKG